MIEIINCLQGSPEWAQARLGIPTASEFASILTKGRGGAESRTRQTYLYKLAGEQLTGEVMESFTSPHMERGKLMEEEARSAYSFVTGQDCESVGFLRRGRAGASPDALIGPGRPARDQDQAAASPDRSLAQERAPDRAQSPVPGTALDRRTRLDRSCDLLAGAAPGAKTARDLAVIAEAKRREARHLGIKPIASRGFNRPPPQMKASRPLAKPAMWRRDD